MSEFNDLLEQELKQYRMPHRTLDEAVKRHERRQRRHRVATALLAFTIATVGVGATVRAFVADQARPSATPGPEGQSGGIGWPVSSTLQFIDEFHGWMVDSQGRVFATSNGGQSWASQGKALPHIHAVDFVDTLNGWALSSQSLFNTSDGGATWHVATMRQFKTVQFVTRRIGWGVTDEGDAMGIGKLMSTTDGGLTWKFRGLTVQSVCYGKAGNVETVWAVGPGAPGMAVLRSDDAGESWTNYGIALPLPEELGLEPQSGAKTAYWSAAVRCAGSSAWVLVDGGMKEGHIAYALFRATDEESSPKPLVQDSLTHPVGGGAGIYESSDPIPGPFSVLDEAHAVILTWCPPCNPSITYRTTGDGGITWISHELSDRSRLPEDVAFINRNVGWLLLAPSPRRGGHPLVLKTVDGGKTWVEP
jgi:photosystem II stability/assembly factor-like uncharacterized protein